MGEVRKETVVDLPRSQTEFTWIGQGGIRLVGSKWGASEAQSVVFTHGAGQTRYSWNKSAQKFPEFGFSAITTDMRGHGDSEWAPDGDYSIDAMIEDLRLLLASQSQPPILVGASMGGITSLIGLGEGHISCSALVLVDVAPKVNFDGVAKIIAFMNEHLDGFASLEEAQEAIFAYNPHRSQAKAKGSSDGLKKNLRLKGDGRYYWHWDPAFLSKREKDDLQDLKLLEKRKVAAARNVKVPVLLVRGVMSELVSEESAKDLQELIPQAKVVEIDKAGHMVAGDSNDVFSKAVMDFVNKI